MTSKNLKILNEPFVLWFLSSVLLAFISWQYTELQKNSAEKKVQEHVIKKANLELNLLLQDIEFYSSLENKTTASHLTNAITLMQYNAVNKTNQFYVPTLQNVMLEIDSRTKSKGLEKYQRKVFKHLTVISNSVNRIITPMTRPNDYIWNRLTDEEKLNLKSLKELTLEITDYYKLRRKSS